MNELITKAEENRNNRQILCELNSTKARLEKIMEYRTRGTILRSRARWHEHREHNNKYFYSLEKRNYSRKLVSKLKLNDGSFTTNQFEILEEQKNFYQSLYQSQLSTDQDIHDGDIFFNLNNIPTLDFDFLLDCRYDLNLLQLHNLPPFYHSVLKYWQDYRSVISEDIIQVQNEIIWNNNNMLMNQSTMFFKRWYKNGIIPIRDLLNVDFTFLSLDQFQRKYHLQVPFTTYYGLINSIPSSWRRKLKSTNFSNPSENSSEEPPPKNITTHSAYAAILDYFFPGANS